MPETGKIEVWFSGERRVLVHGRTPAPEATALPPRKPSALDSDD